MRTLYIEGEADQSLKMAFHDLLIKELKGKMPKIVMCGGCKQTIDNFLNQPLATDEKRFLLLDSDQAVTGSRQEYIVAFTEKFNTNHPKRVHDSTAENTFLMVQEVEAWILSQSGVIDKHYKTDKASAHFSSMNIQSIEDPSDKLAKFAENKLNKEYHKIRDFAKMFPCLDTALLKGDFKDFDDLIRNFSA